MSKANVWVYRTELLNKAKIKILARNPKKIQLGNTEIVETALEEFVKND